MLSAKTSKSIASTLLIFACPCFVQGQEAIEWTEEPPIVSRIPNPELENQADKNGIAFFSDLESTRFPRLPYFLRALEIRSLANLREEGNNRNIRLILVSNSGFVVVLHAFETDGSVTFHASRINFDIDGTPRAIEKQFRFPKLDSLPAELLLIATDSGLWKPLTPRQLERTKLVVGKTSHWIAEFRDGEKHLVARFDNPEIMLKDKAIAAEFFNKDDTLKSVVSLRGKLEKLCRIDYGFAPTLEPVE